MKKIFLQNFLVALIFFTLQFLLGLLSMYDKADANMLAHVLIFSGFGTLLFITAIVILQIYNIRKHKISTDKFSLSPTQSSVFTVNISEVASIDIIENILPQKIDSGKFKYDKKLNCYKAATKITLSSWGEIILIKLVQVEANKTQWDIVSKPSLKTTLVDYGKSSINIQKIKSVFTQNCS